MRTNPTMPVYNTPGHPFITRQGLCIPLIQVVQGVMRADPKSTGAPNQLLCLWLHECSRVFEDRLTTDDDHTWFRTHQVRVWQTLQVQAWQTAADTCLLDDQRMALG